MSKFKWVTICFKKKLDIRFITILIFKYLNYQIIIYDKFVQDLKFAKFSETKRNIAFARPNHDHCNLIPK